VHHNQIAAPFATSPQITVLHHAPSTTISGSPTAPITPAELAFVYCEICAAASLAGNGVPATPPQMCVPVCIRQKRFWLQIDAAFAASPHRPFQARAPPHA
jgi:hypothetical protein